MVSASPGPPTELSSEIEATPGMEAAWEPMSGTTQQEKLLKKLNLDGLSNWTPWNAATAWDLVLAFYNIFALEGNDLGCTSAIKHEICITDSEPFKEQFRCIPTPGYARCRGDMSQPVPMVQHSGTGEKERWITALLHGILQT